MKNQFKSLNNVIFIIIGDHCSTFVEIQNVNSHVRECLTGLTIYLFPQVTANDADVDRPNNIIYFLTGPGINAENPSDSNFDINKATGEIFVLKVSYVSVKV